MDNSVSVTPALLRERIGRLPRIPFTCAPTPLHELPRLAEAIGGPRIFVKREDLTGFAFGGNKVRALEFRMADAKAKGCDVFMLHNVGVSNHARLHTAAAKRLGMRSVIIRPGPVDERVEGNLLLDHILGAEIIPAGTPDTQSSRQVYEAAIEDLRRQGHKPYDSVHEPFSGICGTIAYTEMAIELIDQLRAMSVKADHVFLLAGTSTPGLAWGGNLFGGGFRVHGVSNSTGANAAASRRWLKGLADQAAERLDLPATLAEDDFDLHTEYLGDGYWDVTDGTKEAIRLAARTEGLFLDPIYTGKAMSAVIGEIRNGHIRRDETVVFVHTGGLPIIFQYPEVLAQL